MIGYLRTLNWCIHNRWKTIGAGTLFFALSIVGSGADPEVVRARCGLRLAQSAASSCRTGVRLEDTAATSAAAYSIVARQPEVANVVESIGAGRHRRDPQPRSCISRSCRASKRSVYPEGVGRPRHQGTAGAFRMRRSISTNNPVAAADATSTSTSPATTR